MSEQQSDNLAHQLAAEFLRSQAGPMAEAASAWLLGHFPDINARYAPTPHECWKESLASRVRDLAEAIAMASPELFCAQVAWAKAAFVARGVPVSDIRASLTALREVAATHVPADDRPLVESYLARAERALAAAPDAPAPVLSVQSPHGELAARYLLALLEGDRPRACAMLVDAVPRLSLHEVHAHVIAPVMYELGRMWHLNEVTVAEEHFATATTLAGMSLLMARLPRRPSNGKTLLAACIQGNAHELGLRMVADTFELEGWRVVYLGADVPSDALAMAVRDFDASLVALSVTLHSQLQTLADAIALIRKAATVKIIVGGYALESAEAVRQLGADGYAKSAAESLKLGAKLCGLAEP